MHKLTRSMYKTPHIEWNLYLQAKQMWNEIPLLTWLQYPLYCSCLISCYSFTLGCYFCNRSFSTTTSVLARCHSATEQAHHFSFPTSLQGIRCIRDMGNKHSSNTKWWSNRTGAAVQISECVQGQDSERNLSTSSHRSNKNAFKIWKSTQVSFWQMFGVIQIQTPWFSPRFLCGISVHFVIPVKY